MGKDSNISWTDLRGWVLYRVKTYFRWYDFWVGAYLDVKKRTLYVCLLPMWVIEFKFTIPLGENGGTD